MTNETSVTPFSATIADLSTRLLETDPYRYSKILEDLSDNLGSAGDEKHVLEHKEALKNKLNEKPYETWESNHAFSLSRLVGKMNQGAIDEGYEAGSYYGSSNPGGISQDLGISLLKMIVNCGGDIMAEDYYENSIVYYLSHPEFNKFHRTGNEEFAEFVKSIYESKDQIEEGVPPEPLLSDSELWNRYAMY